MSSWPAVQGDLSRRDTHHRDINQPAPATRRSIVGSTAMFGHLHEEVARQRHREACLEARRFRLARAVRAESRARRAVERAARAGERAGAEGNLPGLAVSR